MKRLCFIAILSALMSLLIPQFASASCAGCNQAMSYDEPLVYYPKIYKKAYKRPYKRRYRQRARRYRAACSCSCPTPQSCIHPNYFYNPVYSCQGYYYGRWYLGYRAGWDSCDILVEYGVTVRVYRFFPVPA